MTFDNYIFRCSEIGNIISKSGKLTEGVKSFLNEKFIEAKYNVRKEISSKYLEKGIWQEEDGLALLQNTLHKGTLVLKNKNRNTNDFITGEHDTVVNDNKEDIVYDIKNAWDVFTFSKAELTWEYEWQLIGYGWLLNISKARLFYCLNNTPEHILIDEERKLFYKHRFLSDTEQKYINMCISLRKAHDYSNFPLCERFKVWDVEITEDKIKKIESAVFEARKYLNELERQHKDFINKNLDLMGLKTEVPS